MPFIREKYDDVAIATIRTLAVDTVGKANSGHPGRSHPSWKWNILLKALRDVGAPLGMAPVAHILFSRWALKSNQAEQSFKRPNCRFINANPKNSKWFNRDRFVLSNGFVQFHSSEAFPNHLSWLL